MYFNYTSQIDITNIFFISTSINAVKNKADIYKSIIMHD